MKAWSSSRRRRRRSHHSKQQRWGRQVGKIQATAHQATPTDLPQFRSQRKHALQGGRRREALAWPGLLAA